MRFNPEISVKIYPEGIFLYNRKTDELYEIDEEFLQFLRRLSKNPEVLEELDSETLQFLQNERLITEESDLDQEIQIFKFPLEEKPSLRYLHIILTTRCNFSCLHCFVEEKPNDMPFKNLKEAIEEFVQSGGLRLIFSGGEPLLYPQFNELNYFLKEVSMVRRILLSNGWILSQYSKEMIESLNFDEIQLSLDGTKDTHDRIRRNGSFDAVIKAAEKLNESGISVSFATVINRLNAEEFDEILKLVKKFNAFRWTIDFICPVDKAVENNLVPELEAAKLVEYSFNSNVYPTEGNFACGANLASLLPDGTLAKCDFFPEVNGGNAFKEGLINAWKKLKKIELSELECSECEKISYCKGGCRYRAFLYNKNMQAKDPAACIIYGRHEGG